MIWVFIVVGAALILFIAWFAITLVTTRLNATPQLAVFDIEEATLLEIVDEIKAIEQIVIDICAQANIILRPTQTTKFEWLLTLLN